MTKRRGADHDDTIHDRAPGTERGASLVEYALLLALIAIVLVTAVGVFGESVDSMYSDADDALVAHVQG